MQGLFSRQFKEESHSWINDTKEIIPRGNIAILIVATSISGASNIALSFLPIYFTKLGGTVMEYGVIMTFATLVAMPTTFLGGAISGRYSLKRIAILTSWIGPAVLAGYYVSNSWSVLSIPILAGGLGSIGSIAWRQLVADATTSRSRTAQLSIYQTLTAVPSMFAPLAGGYLVHSFGVVDGFRVGVLISLALAPLSTILLVRLLREKSPDPRSSEEKTIQCVGSNPQVFRHLKTFGSTMTTLPKPLAPLLSAYVLVILANATTNPYLIFYSTGIAKLDTLQWGVILSLQLVLANTIRTPLGIVSDRFDKRKVLLLSLVATAPLSTFLVFERSFGAILGILLAMIITGISYTPTHEALQIEITPREKRPALFAIYDVLRSVSTSAGTIAGAVLFTANYALPFFSYTAMEACAGAIIGLSFFPRPRRRPLSVPSM